MKLKPQPKTAFSGFNPPEDALQNLLDSTPFAMFSVDRNYRYTAFNRAHARMMNLIYGAGIEPGCSLLDYMTVAEDRQKAKQNLDRALAGEAFTDSAYSGEESLSRLFFDVHHMPVRDDQGAVIGASVYSEDVTGLKRAAEDLKNSEDLFRASFMFASIGVTLVSPNDKFLRANPAFCDMLGYSETELSGMTIEDLTFEEDKPASLSFMKNACAGLVNNAHYEKRYIRKDGSFFWADVSSTAFRNDAGELQYLIMHVEDITRAKKVQAELLEHQTRLDELVQQRTRQLSDSETLYRSLFDTISSVIVIFNPDTGRILDANPAACVLFERSYAELINSDMMDMVKMQPSDVQTHAGKILSGEKIFLEAGLRRADGEMRFLGAYPGLIQFKHGPAVLAVLHDITEAKRAEQALQENEALFRASFENATVGVSLVGPDGRFLHVNHKLCDILGYTPEELANMTFNDVTYPEDQDNGSLFGNPDVTGEKDGLRAEKRCVHKDGHMLWVIISFAAVRNPAGELQYFVTHTQDITDHKQLEDKLRQQSRAVESSPASIVITNINGNIEYVNPKFTQITGYTLEEAIGNNPRILKSGETPQDGYKKMWETIMAGEEWRGEFHNKKKNGELYYEWASISPIMDENGKISHFIAVKEDITERKRDQERILEALAFNQTILDSSPIGITIYNAAGDCIAANRAAGLITGTDPLSLLKQNFHTLESWKKNELYPAAMQALRIDQPVSILVHTHSSFKRELWLNATFVAFKSAGETHLLFMFENDSERQKAEKDLKNSNQKLAGLVKDLERRQKDSDLLRQMSDLLQVCTGVQEAYDIIGQFAPQIFLETSGAVFAAAQSPRSMEVASPWGDKLSSDLAFTSENCWSLRRGQVYLAKSSLPGLKCQHMDKAFVGSYLDIPLVASGEILGLLHIEWPQMEEPDRSMQDMAQIFADNISLSLSNIKLRETLHNQSVRDPLTHAFNRRYMEETLTRELPRAKRKNSHVGLIMLDIDYFKKFNDTYGHATGDLILTRLSSLLQSLVRGEDIVCRMGGEEFLMIMPDTDRETAFQRAEMIREAVQALRIEYNNQSLSGLTVSAGVAVYPENGRTSEQILEKVDAALYLAKGNGRNRVEQADGT